MPEGRHVFATLPVEANLLLGAYGRVFSLEIVTSTLRYVRSKEEVRERLERVYTLLPQLRELRERPAGRTSGGQQQMVAIGRALMAEPRLLAIDELSLGLAPLLVQQLAEFLLRLNEEDGVAILLVDQSASLAFSLCERAYVLETGRVVLEGASRDLEGRAEVRSAYLGEVLGGAGVTTFFQLVVVGISTGSVFAIVGMSLVLVYRATGIVNFAQGVFAVLGGLLTYSLGKHVSLFVRRSARRCSITAFDRDARRGRRRRHPRAHDAAREPDHHRRDRSARRGGRCSPPSGRSRARTRRSRIAPGTSAACSIQPQYAVLALVAVAAAVGLTLFLRRTIVGQALVASADSPRAAELIGLNLRSVAVIAFAIAGALTAIGGVLLAPTVPVTYNADLSITINGFAAAVFGGLASIRLALLGGYALGIVEQLVVGYVDPQYNLIIALAVMLVLIGWRSRGELAI